MNITLTVFCLTVLCCLKSYSQDPVDYKVRHKPLLIHDKPDGKILIRVPRNRTITISSYNVQCDCFNASYLEFRGIIHSGAWLNDIYGKPGKKNQYTDTISDSIQRLLIEYRLAADGKSDGVFTVEKENSASETGMKRTTDLIDKFGYTYGRRIAEGKIWLGMTVDMTLESWGIPYRVNRNQGSWGIREQWIYSEAYLYFENGILTEIYRVKLN